MKSWVISLSFQDCNREHRLAFLDAEHLSAAMVPSFIDNLDEECACRLFRFVSERPNHPRWSRHIAPENLQVTLRLGGLRGAAKTAITRVGTEPVGGLFEKEEDGYSTVNSADQLLEVATAPGDSLTHLQVSSVIALAQDSVLLWTEVLTTSVKALQKLDIAGLRSERHAEALLVALTGRVEALRTSPEQMPARVVLDMQVHRMGAPNF